MPPLVSCRERQPPGANVRLLAEEERTAVDDKEVSQQITQILEACRERGMSLPYHVAALGSNGTGLIARYSDALSYDVIYEQIDDRTSPLPVNILIVDAAGEAVRATLENGEIQMDYVRSRGSSSAEALQSVTA